MIRTGKKPFFIKGDMDVKAIISKIGEIFKNLFTFSNLMAVPIFIFYLFLIGLIWLEGAKIMLFCCVIGIIFLIAWVCI